MSVVMDYHENKKCLCLRFGDPQHSYAKIVKLVLVL